MKGCELIKCPDFKNGICNNKSDYVNKYTGENMCPRNSDAISREEFKEEGK